MREPDQDARLRDHFAAAALTGLLAGRKFTALDDAIVAEAYAEAAYGIADAMLRERGNHIPDAGKMVEKPTNHDAAPAARASLPTADHAVCRGCESGCGTGDTQEPVAWAVVYPNDEVAVIAFKRRDADERATASDRIVPLYRRPQDGVVRLPPLDPNGAPGWNAAIGAVREALANAGVDWDTE
jgi:hypothetical protein